MRGTLALLTMLALTACGAASGPDPATSAPDEPTSINFDDDAVTATATDDAARAAPAAPVDSDDAATWAPWVQASVRAHRSAFAQCYGSLLTESPGASGRAVLAFVVHPDGSVGDVELSSSSFAATPPTFSGCLTAAISGITFPPSTEPSRVFYPLLFSPGDAPAAAPPPSTTPP